MSNPAPKSPGLDISWTAVVMTIVGVVAFSVLIVHGWSYYQLPWPMRFESPAHKALRSSGSTGHMYGYVGTVLIVTNLLYLVRRRFSHVQGWGSMRLWMQWHVLSGLLGPSFILLHSAFLMRTWPTMVSSISLIVVVATGLLGRYLYRLLPHGPDGRLRTSDELAGEVDRGLFELRSLPAGGIEAAALLEERVDEAVDEAHTRHTSGFGALAGTIAAFWRLRGLGVAAREVAAGAGADSIDARHIGNRAAKIAGLVLRADALDTLATAANSWRGLHRNLVVLMLLTASLHISVSIYLGFM